IEYENDAAFFRESDLFDDDLDREIRAENIAVQQKEAEEIGEMARQFQMEPDSEKYYDETCSKPRRKGSYARHGVEFKFRKATGSPFQQHFLASMMGQFRVLPEITLAAIQVFVDEMFHIKISPNCGKRTKEKH
ncbi:hypothetical protein Leryth_023791, partial [Lithospermum erythrorhizon]